PHPAHVVLVEAGGLDELVKVHRHARGTERNVEGKVAQLPGAVRLKDFIEAGAVFKEPLKQSEPVGRIWGRRAVEPETLQLSGVGGLAHSASMASFRRTA